MIYCIFKDVIEFARKIKYYRLIAKEATFGNDIHWNLYISFEKPTDKCIYTQFIMRADTLEELKIQCDLLLLREIEFVERLNFQI